jgi:16S rRNA (guanine(966)-N(2))-methyltransferase RsmD
MRVISGKYKSRRFSPPKNFPSRPTTDSAKEGLFNILDNRLDLEDADVLDMFAGTGNISLEFLSREAKYVLSVDSHFVSFKYMKKSMFEVGAENWKVIKNDVFKYVPKLDKQFDIVFADPPFGLKNIYDIPALILESTVLKDDGLLIVEHGRETVFTKSYGFESERNYGGVYFSFFSK